MEKNKILLKENLIYIIMFVVSLISIVVGRICIGFDSILWISDIASIALMLNSIFMAKHSAWGYVFNIVASVLFITTSIIQHVWFSAVLVTFVNLPNVVYGLIVWKKNEKENKQEQNIQALTKKQLTITIVATTILSIIATIILYFLKSNLFYLDAPFSVICMVGVYLASKRKTEQFYFFIFGNMVGIAMFVLLSIQNVNNLAYILSYVVLTIVNIFGLMNWKKLYKQKLENEQNQNLSQTTKKEEN